MSDIVTWPLMKDNMTLGDRVAMAKFCEFRDLFKWNKQLMEDDWNDGQAYFLKTVNKGGDAVSFYSLFFWDD